MLPKRMVLLFMLWENGIIVSSNKRQFLVPSVLMLQSSELIDALLLNFIYYRRVVFGSTQNDYVLGWIFFLHICICIQDLDSHVDMTFCYSHCSDGEKSGTYVMVNFQALETSHHFRPLHTWSQFSRGKHSVSMMMTKIMKNNKG